MSLPRFRPRGELGRTGFTATCVRYTLTLDPDVALLGLKAPNEHDSAFAAAAAFEPFTEDEVETVRRRALEAVANKGGMHWNPDAERC